jgi:hypothetical protein
MLNLILKNKTQDVGKLCLKWQYPVLQDIKENFRFLLSILDIAENFQDNKLLCFKRNYANTKMHQKTPKRNGVKER